MGFWSTLLVALRFKADRVPVVTGPLHLFRLRIDTANVHRVRNDGTSVHRLRLEAN